MEKIAIREQTPRPHAVTLPVRPLYVHLPTYYTNYKLKHVNSPLAPCATQPALHAVPLPANTHLPTPPAARPSTISATTPNTVPAHLQNVPKIRRRKTGRAVDRMGWRVRAGRVRVWISSVVQQGRRWV